MFYTVEIHKMLQDCFHVEVSYISQNYHYWFFMTDNVEMKVSKDNCDTYYRVWNDSEWKYDFNLLK